MSLYDVIDEISEEHTGKTEYGDNRIYGVALGSVAKNYDKDMPGRLCVSVPVRDKEANELKWARLAMTSGGKNWGHYFMPEAGDQVLLTFENGNIEKPFVIGCVYFDGSRFLSGAADENNQFKQIMTRNGSTVIFEDNKEGEGEKDKITVRTAKKRHMIALDNENKKIVIQDEKGDNRIEMMTEKGQMKIVAAKSLEILVGDSIKIRMNGETGAVKLEAAEFSVKASKQVKLESDGTLSEKGAQVLLNGSTMVKVESSGILKLSGTPVSIG